MHVCPATFQMLQTWPRGGGCGSGKASVHLLSGRQSVVVRASLEDGRSLFLSPSPPVSPHVMSVTFVFRGLYFHLPLLCHPSLHFFFPSSFLPLLSASMTHFLGPGPINHRVVGRGSLPFLPGCPSSSKQVIESERGSRSQQ